MENEKWVGYVSIFIVLATLLTLFYTFRSSQFSSQKNEAERAIFITFQEASLYGLMAYSAIHTEEIARINYILYSKLSLTEKDEAFKNIYMNVSEEFKKLNINCENSYERYLEKMSELSKKLSKYIHKREAMSINIDYCNYVIILLQISLNLSVIARAIKNKKFLHIAIALLCLGQLILSFQAYQDNVEVYIDLFFSDIISLIISIFIIFKIRSRRLPPPPSPIQ